MLLGQRSSLVPDASAPARPSDDHRRRETGAVQRGLASACGDAHRVRRRLRRQGLLFISLLLLTIVGVSWLWNRLSLWGVSYRRRFSERRAFCGETVEVALEVDNHKLLPLSWLRVEDTFPIDLPLDGGRWWSRPPATWAG